MKIFYIIFVLITLFISINTQVSWTVENAPFSLPLVPNSNEEAFANKLKNDIEQALLIPKTPGYCKKQNPDFPLDSGIMCNAPKIGKDLAWKLDFRFKETQRTNYKFEVGGDFGRGMCMFVNGQVYNTMQRDVWWGMDWANDAVLRLNFDFEPGENQIVFYGGENCCEGLQSMRFDRNYLGWRVFTQENVLDIMPFVCTFPCEKCSMDPTECYTCEGENRYVSDNCACQDGYYEDTDLICKKCYTNCRLCDNFTTCNESMPTYYLSSNKQQAIKCPYMFNTCSSATVGITCKGTNRSTLAPNCYCNDGYYDDGSNSNCVKCPLKFAKCSNPSTGLQCQGTNRSATLPSCPCNKGYYNEGSNPQNCTECEANCTQCSSGTVCTECEDSYYLNSQSCTKCPLKFAKCSSASVGILCQGLGRSQQVPTCPCNDQYYEASGNNKDCNACVSPCVTCTTSTSCKSCIVGKYLTGNSCSTCPLKYSSCSNATTGIICANGTGRSDVIPECNCLHGFYEGSTNSQNCIQCTSPCKYCENDNDCLSCIDGYYLSNKRCLKCPLKYAKCSSPTVGTECAIGTGRGSTIPDCQCTGGYYENTINSENCLPCVYPCVNCESPTQCTSCALRDFINPIPSCTCSDGYYEKSDKTCSICTHPCSKCIDSTSKCTQCVSTVNRNNTPSCLCKDGFFDNGTDMDCKACVHPCSKCTGLQINQCTECIVRDNANASPNCHCKDGYYEDSDKNCVKCPNKFSKCNNANVGIECAAGTGRSSTIPDCLCNNTYFENGQADCVSCTFPCINCSSPTSCDSCAVRDFIQSKPSCHCLDGYYELSSDQTCKICTHPCKKCNNTDTQCTECVSNINRLSYPSCLCQDGFFDNGIDMGCQVCQHPCTKCTGIAVNQCTECVVRPNANDSPNCHCKDGYYEDSDLKCVKCPKQCSKCSDKNTCTECAVGVGRSSTLPSCKCESNYFDDGSASVDCIICIHPCQTCINLTQCDTCISRQFINNSPDCHCQQGYYEDSISLSCIQCQHPCSQCSGSKTNCDLCVAGNYRKSKPDCSCQEGFYQNEDKDCVPCIYPCKKCSSDTICTECSTEQNRLLPPNDNSECGCQDGYFDDDSKCEQCNYKCELCIDTSTNCKKCSEITRHGALCKCIDGFYDIGVPECEACDYMCKTCITSSDNCIVCSDVNRDILNNCQCKDGFYEDKQDMQCKQCIFPCLYCSSKFVCESCFQTGDIVQDNLRNGQGCSCISGYYEDSENICQKCHSRCEQCKGQDDYCLECKIYKGRLNQVPHCKCQDQYYFTLTLINDQGIQTETCEKCLDKCQTCTNNESCLTCNNKHILPPLCEEFVKEEVGIMSLSVNLQGSTQQDLQICELQCLECEDLINNCKKCKPGLNRNMISPQCGCLKGYYASNNIDCQPCQQNCTQCETYNLCKECTPNKNLVVNKKSGECQCAKGFKMIQNQCVICYQHNHECLAKCPENTIQNEENHICIQITKEESESNTQVLIKTLGVVIILMILGKIILMHSMKQNINKFTKINNSQNNFKKNNSSDSIENDSERININ